MTEPEYEPMTPVESENLLRVLGRQNREAPRLIEAARDDLVAARKVLTSAKAALTIARAKATLSPECPIVGRGTGETTVAVRDSWVVMQTLAEQAAVVDAEAAVQAASAKLQAAEDNRKSLREQTMVATSINSSVREAYRGTGGGPR